MNYLQLTQRLRRKCRVGGTGPVAVTGQNEEYSRLLDYINAAWLDVQESREDWQWMRSSCSFTTTNSQATYTVAQIGLTDWGNWHRDSFRQYLTASGTNTERELHYMDYEDWRNAWQLGSPRNTPSQPWCMTITPAKSIGLGPVPLAGYTITGDYYTVPTEMATATDTPGLDSRFHMLIVYRAMMFYGVGEAAPEVYQEGMTEFNRMMNRLNLNQLPEVTVGGALE